MAKEVKKLAWTTFSVANNPVLKAKEAAIRKAMAEVSKLKAEFEPLAIAALVKANVAVSDDTNTVRIGYNYGQLSYAQDKPNGATKAAAVEL